MVILQPEAYHHLTQTPTGRSCRRGSRLRWHLRAGSMPHRRSRTHARVPSHRQPLARRSPLCIRQRTEKWSTQIAPQESPRQCRFQLHPVHFRSTGTLARDRNLLHCRCCRWHQPQLYHRLWTAIQSNRIDLLPPCRKRYTMQAIATMSCCRRPTNCTMSQTLHLSRHRCRFSWEIQQRASYHRTTKTLTAQRKRQPHPRCHLPLAPKCYRHTYTRGQCRHLPNRHSHYASVYQWLP